MTAAPDDEDRARRPSAVDDVVEDEGVAGGALDDITDGITDDVIDTGVTSSVAAPAPAALPRATTPPSMRTERSDFALPRAQRVTVQEGETLEDVADEYGVTVTALLRANPQVRDAARVFAGEELRLPALGRNTASRPPTDVSRPPMAASTPGLRVPPEVVREARARAKKEEARDVARAAAVDPRPPRHEDVAAGLARFHAGHEGPAIRELQARLNSAGFRVPETGRFGATMQFVVKQLQREHGLVDTGAVGQATLDALGAAELAAVRDYRMSLRPHAEGAAVRHVQRLLGVTVTDVFDATTDEAVRAFQAARGLVEDGVVGIRTLAALEGASTAATASRVPGEQAAAPRLDHFAFPGPRAPAQSAAAVALMTRAQQGEDVRVRADVLADASDVDVPGLGAGGAALAAHLSRHGLRSTFRAGGVDDVVAALQQGRPVPLGVESFGGVVLALDDRSARYPSLRPGDAYAHRFGATKWVLVTGFKGDPLDPTAFVVNDPDSGATVEVSRRELERHAAPGGALWIVLPA